MKFYDFDDSDDDNDGSNGDTDDDKFDVTKFHGDPTGRDGGAITK